MDQVFFLGFEILEKKTERQYVSVNMELDVSRMPDWIQTAVDPTSRRWIEKSDGGTEVEILFLIPLLLV